MLGVHDLDVGVGDDVAGGHDAGPLFHDADIAGLATVQAQPYALEVEDDFRNVLGDAGRRGEFVQNALDAHGCDRRPLERRKQNAA